MSRQILRNIHNTLTVPAQFKNLKKIRRFVKKFIRQAGFNEDESYKVQLAVDEGCSNIIEHAYTGENQGDIVCSCECSNEELIIQLVDYGKSFDPERIEAPDLHSSLKDRKTGGLGLYFMHQLMDEVTFTIVPESVAVNGEGVVDRPANMLVIVKRRSR